LRLIRRLADCDFYGGDPVFFDFVSRHASRGVLIDSELNAAMMFMSELNLYKLPGGGLEDGESREQAFLREIKEETGFDCEILFELGYLDEHKNQNQYMQRSYCYIASIRGSSSAAALTENEIALGMYVRWMPIHEAIKEMKDAALKCEDYSTKFMILRDCIILEEAAAKLTAGEPMVGRS
jgi:8-oxo-dGTP diphosphatase